MGHSRKMQKSDFLQDTISFHMAIFSSVQPLPAADRASCLLHSGASFRVTASVSFQFLAGRFLTIYAGYLFYPTCPPFVFLLHYSRIFMLHGYHLDSLSFLLLTPSSAARLFASAELAWLGCCTFSNDCSNK